MIDTSVPPPSPPKKRNILDEEEDDFNLSKLTEEISTFNQPHDYGVNKEIIGKYLKVDADPILIDALEDGSVAILNTRTISDTFD